MDSTDLFSVKRPLPIFTKLNHVQWFNLAQSYFTLERIFYAVQQTLNFYAAVVKPETSSNDLTANLIASSTANPTPSSLLTNLGLNVKLNIDKKAKWITNNAKACYWITICISEIDQERVQELDTAKEKWDSLKLKYLYALPLANRQAINDLTSYKKPSSATIEKAWVYLKDLKKQVVAADLLLSTTFDTTKIFQFLLYLLPEEYETVKDGLNARESYDAENGLFKLLEKEARLKILAESALWSKHKDYGHKDTKDNGHKNTKDRSRSSRRRQSSSSGSDRNDRLKCFFCKGPHLVADCSSLPSARRFIENKKLKSRSSSRSNLTAVKKDLLRKFLRQSFNTRKRHRAYSADEDSDDESDESEDSSKDEDYEKIAALSKAAAGKVPKSAWVADSGASSYITDQLRLFNGPLIRIKRRTIKVGGGKLYADYCGTVTIKDRQGNSVLLSSTLYIPQLGVNLLSGKKICEKGLEGGFNRTKLYMRDKTGKRIITATQIGGVYIVTKIFRGLDDFALYATVKRTFKKAFPSQLLKPRRATLPPFTYNYITSPELLGVTPGSSTKHEISLVDNQDPPILLSGDITTNARDRYTLWHRRYAYLGSAKIRDLYKVTTLDKPITIAVNHDNICKVCAFIKFRNQRNHIVSERKTDVLALVSIDIYGALPIFYKGYVYFLLIVDNHSRKIWNIPLRQKSDAIPELKKWKAIVELQTGTKLQAVRSDNAPELKSIFNEWCATFGITP